MIKKLFFLLLSFASAMGSENTCVINDCECSCPTNNQCACICNSETTIGAYTRGFDRTTLPIITTVNNCIDCNGNNCSGYEGWVGDGICDDGCYELNFMCDDFNFDEGDCIDGR